MQIIYGDLFQPETYYFANGMRPGIRPSAIVVTTNGFVKRTGEAVMGRGCARKLVDMSPKMPLYLGQSIKKYGNITQVIGRLYGLYDVVSFPVKPSFAECRHDKSNVVQHMQDRMAPGKMVPGWACIADVELIARSARQLVELANKKGWASIVLPRPGCGAGELNWNDIKPVLDAILDDDFYVITYGKRNS